MATPDSEAIERFAAYYRDVFSFRYGEQTMWQRPVARVFRPVCEKRDDAYVRCRACIAAAYPSLVRPNGETFDYRIEVSAIDVDFDLLPVNDSGAAWQWIDGREVRERPVFRSKLRASSASNADELLVETRTVVLSTAEYEAPIRAAQELCEEVATSPQ